MDPIFKGKGADCRWGIGDGVWPNEGVVLDFEKDPQAEKAVLRGRNNGVIGTAYHGPTTSGRLTLAMELTQTEPKVGDEVLLEEGGDTYIVESAPVRQTTGDWVKMTMQATYYPDMEL